MRVLDSSVGFKLLVPETGTENALRLRGEDLIAPDVYPIEIAHALGKAGRAGRLPVADTMDLLSEALETLPVLHPALPLLPRAYEIASAARIGVYDCLYVALAEREHCELVTADQKLISNLEKDFPFIVSLHSIQL